MQTSQEAEDTAGTRRTSLLTGNTHWDVWPTRDKVVNHSSEQLRVGSWGWDTMVHVENTSGL